MSYEILALPSQVTRLLEEMEAIKELLKGLVGVSETQNEVIGIEELCELSGYSKNTIYQLKHKNAIPYHKPEHGGRKLIFFRSEIEAWLKGKKPETSDEFCERKELELINEYDGGLN